MTEPDRSANRGDRRLSRLPSRPACLRSVVQGVAATAPARLVRLTAPQVEEKPLAESRPAVDLTSKLLQGFVSETDRIGAYGGVLQSPQQG